MGEAEPIDGRGAPAGPRVERTGAVPRPEAAQEPADGPGTGAAAADEKPAAGTPTSDWFAPRRTSTNGAGAAMGAGAAAVSGGGGGERALPPSPADPLGDGRADQPYYPDYPDAQSGAGHAGGPGGNAFAPGTGMPPGAGSGPSGPTTGPAAGNTSMGAPHGTGGPVQAQLGQGPQSQQGQLGQGPGPDQLGQGPGQGGIGGEGAPRMSDDTAVLTPQAPAPEPGLPGHVSGDTLTSGIPVIPPDHSAPFPGSGRRDPGPGPDLGTGPYAPGSPGRSGPIKGQAPDPAPAADGLPGAPNITPPKGSAPARAAAAPAPVKKGRSKLLLAVVALIVVAGGFYGAGLLMNHSDVPKGTTVLGVDIGGGTRDDAVKKLDSVLGARASAPLHLRVGGKTAELRPENAGLSLDSQATVRGAAGSDYNPVTVIGSLFGQARVVDPEIPVDQEKLTAALTDLSGTSGSASEGTIKFEPGKAVAVPGKVGKALDVGQSIVSVRDAYRSQVQTGKPRTVELPVTTREPTISQAELDRAMKDFAEPAMSGLVTIKAGDKQIQFGPAKSLPKILSMKAIDGKLVEVYDKTAITQLLDGVFDGITITKGDGKQHPVSTDDVTHALQQALLGKTPAERTQVIDLDPS
jgi:hypothetical protein